MATLLAFDGRNVMLDTTRTGRISARFAASVSLCDKRSIRGALDRLEAEFDDPEAVIDLACRIAKGAANIDAFARKLFVRSRRNVLERIVKATDRRMAKLGYRRVTR